MIDKLDEDFKSYHPELRCLFEKLEEVIEKINQMEGD